MAVVMEAPTKETVMTAMVTENCGFIAVNLLSF